MNQKINYNFYQISPRKSSNLTAEEISSYLTRLNEISNYHNQELPESFLFISEVEILGELITGTIILGRMNNLAGNVDSATKKVTPLGLETTQGLEKHSTFLIDLRANILVLETNGVTTRLFLNYLSEITTMPKTDVAVIINPSEIQKFYAMHTITKFTVKLAKLESGSVFSNSQNKSILQVTNSADETNTDELTYTLKVDRKNNNQKSLSKAKITNFVRDFLRFKETEEVKELKVSGEYNDDYGHTRFTPIDLIQERLHDFIEIEKDSRNSSIFKTAEKIKKLRTLYQKHRSDIINTYSIKA